MDSTYHRPSPLPWTKKTPAHPKLRWNLLDNLVEDDVPITRGLSRLLRAALAGARRPDRSGPDRVP